MYLNESQLKEALYAKSGCDKYEHTPEIVF